jgi:hypothetical protein
LIDWLGLAVPALSAPAQEHLVPVEVQVAALEMGKGLLYGGLLVLDAHPGEGISIGARRYEQEARILEADVALVEKMIDGGREEQAVLAVQALLVIAMAPGLDVAADRWLGSATPVARACFSVSASWGCG